jgi:hypothetical protein
LNKNIKIFQYFNSDKLIKDPENGNVVHTYKNAGTFKLKFKHKIVNDINQDLCGGWDYILDQDRI